MVDFLNKLELSDQKYHSNGKGIAENYKGKFLFPMKDFVSFGKYTFIQCILCQTYYLKKNNGFHVA